MNNAVIEDLLPFVIGLSWDWDFLAEKKGGSGRGPIRPYA
jgi:hypothetical protein